LDPVPRELRNDLYYSADELKEQKDADIAAKQDAESKCDDDPVDTDERCMRGLEHVLHKTERRKHIHANIQAVLEAHNEQAELGYLDEYELFIVSRWSTLGDRKKARRIGKVDAQEAAQVLSSDSDSSCNSTPPCRRRNSKARDMMHWLSGTFLRLRSSRSLKSRSSNPLR